MVPISSLVAPFVDKANKLIQPWQAFLQQFVQAPPKFLPLIVGVSPFAYQAVEPGFVSINGGTVSVITLTRGTDTITITGTNIIPVAIADTVTITYSVKPTVRFIPNYGNRTG